jgi:hypothetical protein
MERQTKHLIDKAMEMFAQTTGMKVAYKAKAQNEKNDYPDGRVRIDYQDMHCYFAVQAKTRVTRTMVAMEKTQPMMLGQDRILVTEYVTPPIADLMKTMGLFFMDTAGNTYINKPPFYVFIKGNKPPEDMKAIPTKRLFKPAGLKVVFALLNDPEMVNRPYRQVAALTDVALGTVDWIFRDLKEMGFLIEMGRRTRKLTNLLILLKRWVEAYPDQLRPKLAIERFRADHPHWWKDVEITDYDACWGGKWRHPRSPSI